ncbi:MAG TPA: tetratricopeptide repeat protein, partial [Pirellulaceae bacterium]|nr:tetratricopeptide repeat protein [Pirellulaceae bacterium]
IFRLCRETAQREASPERVIDVRKSELCRLEYRLGMTSQALDDVTLLYGPTEEPPVFASFYPDQYAAATQWWRFLAKHQANVGYRERLQTVQQLLKPDLKQPSDDWLKAIALAEDALRAPELDKKTAQTDMIVEAYLAHHQRVKAIEMLQRDDSLGPLYLRLGDLLREEQRYEEAAACYERLAKTQPLALYLYGVCESQLGRNESGAAKRQLAMLLSAENSARLSLFSGLLIRNLPKEVENVRDLFLKTSTDFGVIMARQVGNTYSPQEPQLAADYWTKYELTLVRMSSNLVQDEGYISLPYSIHRLRALGYLVSGQREDFRREIALCAAIKPYDFSVVEESLPKLIEKGWTTEADQLFDKRYEQWVKNCAAYPHATSLSNGLAWTAAISGRKLDEALIYARKSLVLEPNNPSLHDTLAEVHFKRGEVAEAIAAQKKAVELAPGVKLFADRLQKFMEP